MDLHLNLGKLSTKHFLQRPRGTLDNDTQRPPAKDSEVQPAGLLQPKGSEPRTELWGDSDHGTLGLGVEAFSLVTYKRARHQVVLSKAFNP